MGVYDRIASFIPTSITASFERQLRYVGIKVGEKQFVGFLLVFGLGLSIAIAVNAWLFFKFSPIIAFVATFAAFAGGIYFWLSQTAETQGKAVERVLPDVFELIASNVKSGLTTERALFSAARPEFGILSEELKNASKEIMSGTRMEDALMDIPTKIKSTVLERGIWLLVQGIKSGGEIANLLLRLGSDLREENAMKDEISANISMYVILIFAAAVVGAPLLFGISSLIVGILVEQTGSIDISPEQIEEYSSRSQIGRFMGLPTVNITESFIVNFSIVALVITSIFAALTTGAMADGSEREGIKYIPVLLICGLGLFFLVRIVLGGMLGGMATMF
jgi:pilus assembly protein TadC